MHLNGMTNLSWLSLDHTQVTDDGLVHLKGLTNLTVLYLDGWHVTDSGLVRLSGLTKLSALFSTTQKSPTLDWSISAVYRISALSASAAPGSPMLDWRLSPT